MVIVNSPRVEFTNENYKVLEVLSLCNTLENYSEICLKNAGDRILKYLEDLHLLEKKVEDAAWKYPLETKVRFYKIWGSYYL